MKQFLFLYLTLTAVLLAQVAGPNINMVAGTQWPGGDPFLQRQNEPSMAVSSRNGQHLLAGANDYRTVDIPVISVDEPTGDAWLGLFKSFDGGQTWGSTLIPGYPQDTSPAGMASPLKGFQAAADPMVRPGTNGLFYLSGLVFNRGSRGSSSIFVSRFIDDNNLEGSDTIRYLGTGIVDRSNGNHFLDKGTIAVDIPRAGAARCTIPGTPAQSFPGGNVYVAYTQFTGATDKGNADIMFAQSSDCGASWSHPQKISGTQRTNQGAAIAIDPSTGTVYVAWRVFASKTDSDAIMIAASKGSSKNLNFSKPIQVAAINPFDQGDTGISFRTNAFPSMVVDTSGKVYVAWSQRGVGSGGDARIVTVTAAPSSADHKSDHKSDDKSEHESDDKSDPVFAWSPMQIVDPWAGRGHQVMPALSFANAKVTAAWYDFRNDDLKAVYTPVLTPDKKELQYTPSLQADGTIVFDTFVADPAAPYASTSRRHTVDIRAAQAQPASPFRFQPSITVSQYAFGTPANDSSNTFAQLEFNVPNLPLFKTGTLPFIGDYIDIAAATFVPNSDGTWRYNSLASDPDYTHVVWADNRNVVQPADGDWRHYTPVGVGLGTKSLFDPTQQAPACVAGQTGMRNQDIYTAQISPGLGLSSKGNAKPLGGIQREFSVTLQNPTNQTKSYRLTIGNQPAGGKASFLQFAVSGLPDPMTQIDIGIPPLSSAARSVFVNSTDPNAPIPVNAVEITAPNGNLVPNGLQSSLTLNTDVSNPNISNPNISNVELYNPNISNPNISNPNISNPNISNPNISNPNISNYSIANPNISNPNISNPNISNPNISNPNISNPNISNLNISNTALTDASYTISNGGNTASSYTLRLVQSQPVPQGVNIQLIVSGYYKTQVANACNLTFEAHYVPIANITSPSFTQPSALLQPAALDPNVPSFSLLPGENALVTIRVYDSTTSDPALALQHFNPITAIAPVVVSQGANTGTTVPAIPPLQIVTKAVPPTSVNAAFSQTLQAVGGAGLYTWTLASELPGITLAANGTLAGSPTTTGVIPLSVKVTDAIGVFTTANLTLTVTPSIPIIALPSGLQNFTYPATVLTATGTPPFTWNAAGPLPPGMALSPNGVFTGIPTVNGSTTVPVTVTDAHDTSASVTLPVYFIGSSSSDQGATISNVRVNGGLPQVTAAPGAQLTVTLDYSIVAFPGCPGCIDQIQVGFSDRMPAGCAYNGQPRTGVLSGSGKSVTLIAPATPGRYYIAFALTLEYSCLDTWAVPQPRQRFIAVVDVIAPAVSVGNATASAVKINGGGNTANVTPSASYNVSLSYQIGPDGSVIDQLEIGLNSQQPEACPFNPVRATPEGASGSGSAQLTAPAQPGRYFVSMDRSQDLSCFQTTHNWWNSLPANNYARFIGVIDVH